MPTTLNMTELLDENRPPISPSTEAEMDAALEALYANKDQWVQTDVQARIRLIDRILEQFRVQGEAWVRAGQAAKQIPTGHPGRGDDWSFALIPVRQLREFRASLTEIAERGVPQARAPLTTRPDGRVVAPVFPRATTDRLLYAGIEGEIWFKQGITQSEIRAGQAKIYRRKAHRGRVALVLGAGNVSGLVPGDFIYKLFVEDQVVLVKMNPVNDYLGPIIERIYKPLIDWGFLRVVYGGTEQGSYLINHPLVTTLHMTGSDKTHDAIVFGTGETGEANRANRNPQVTKPFSSELGNVTPVIVVPGPWSEDDIETRAQDLAGQLTINAGFNCLTPRVIIQQASWHGRDKLNQGIIRALERIPTRYAYYPGAEDRHEAFIGAHPQAVEVGEPDEGDLPWTYIPGLDANNPDDVAFTTEAFCSVMTETALNAPSAATFLDAAVTFANETLWGTLTAIILVHPASLQDATTRAALDRAIGNLRYGSICVNLPSAFGYALMTTSWGGHSGSTLYDIQSGKGVVNNTLMYDENHIQKSVLRAPFRAPISETNVLDEGFAHLAEKLFRLELNPGPRPFFDLLAEVARQA